MVRKSSRRSKWKPRRMGKSSQVMTKQIFPDKYITKLRYHQNVSIDAGVTHLPTSFLFRANSIFQPPEAVADHQPMGADELEALYRFYVVTSSKITVVFSNTSAASSQMCTIGLRSNSTPITNADTLIENDNISYGVISPDGSGSSVRMLKKTFNAGKFFGIRDPTDTNELNALFTANPSKQAFYHLTCYALGAGINPTQINADVTIEYTITATSPIAMVESTA